MVLATSTRTHPFNFLTSGKQEVAVGIYLLNVGYIDIRQGLWDCDFFLYFTSDSTYYGMNTSAVQRYFPNGHNPEAWEVRTV